MGDGVISGLREHFSWVPLGRKQLSKRGRHGPARARTLCGAALVLLALIASLSLQVSAAQATPNVFSFDRLRSGGSFGPENYVYTAGNVIFPDAGVDPGTFYKFVVTDSAGVNRNPSFPCTPAASYPVANNAYTVAPSDPPSTGAAWKYTLNQYGNANCTGTPAKTTFKSFYVAKLTAYADAGLTSEKASFRPGETAYVAVQGVTPVGNDWSATWLLPSSAVSCANTGGTDRPQASGSGRLPKGTSNYLQYRPNLASGGNVWNREVSYETRPCVALDSAHEGVWSLRVDLDTTNFLSVSAFTLDATAPPLPTIDTGPSGPTGSTSASFNFSDSEAGVSFLCQLDGGAFSACTSPKSYSGLAQGNHSFQVKARDAAGNESSAASRSWTVDTVAPPTPTIDSSPSDPSSSANASFNFSDNEAGVTFRCQLDGGGFSTCNSPQSYSALGEGAHSFQVKARDAAGNESGAATRSWTVDTLAPPTPTIDTGPSGSTGSTSATFSFSDNEAGVSFYCQLDGGAFSACTSPESYSGLAQGDHSFQVKARDAAGNESSAASRSWTVDTLAPPTPTIDSSPPDPSASTSASFGFSDSEAGVSFHCRLDGGGFSSCSSPQTYNGLAEGSHSFQVKARDALGNESAYASYSWTVDTGPPPSPTIDSSPPDPTSSTDASFSFSDSEAGVTFSCQLDGGGFSACSSPQSYNGLADGGHSFQVRARDAVGNESASTNYDWTIDTEAPPSPTIDSSPPDPSDSANASFSFSDSEAGVSFYCQLDGGGFSSCSSPQSYTDLADGGHSFQVTARDGLGNESAPAGYVWTVDSAAPATPTIDSSPPDPSNSTDASFSFSDSEVGVSFYCQLDGGGFSSCSSPQSYTDLAEGSHSFQVKARDALDNESATADYSWTVDTQAPPSPTIDSTPPDPSSSTDASFSFSDSEAGVTFHCQLDGGGFSACSSPQSYSELAEGGHSFQVKARDAAGNESASAGYEWTIVDVPPVITLVTPADGSTTADSTPTFSGVAGTAIGDSVLVTVKVYSGATPTGTPLATVVAPVGVDGGYSIDAVEALPDGLLTAQAEQDDLSGNTGLSAPNTFTVDTEAPPSPTIDSSPPDPSDSASASFSFSDSEAGVSFFCQLDGGGFSACSSPQSYSDLGEGAHSFQVKARDAAGNESTPAGYNWTVDTQAPPSPTIDSSPPDPSSSTSASFSFSDSEAGVSFHCRLDGGAFSTCSSPQSYNGLGEGVHSFQVKARDAAGNESTPAGYSWTVDTDAPPSPTIDSSPPDPSSSTSASFTFSDSEAGVSFFCKLDGGGFSACSSPQSYSDLADGGHSFQVKARDALGNESETADYNWTVDTQAPPSPTIDSSPPNPSGSTSASFTFSDSEAGVSFFCKLDAGGLSACTSPKSYTDLGEGGHSFQVKARDAVGNESAP